MRLKPTPTKKMTPVGNVMITGWEGFIKEVPVSFLEEEVKMEFLVVHGVPVDVLIGSTDLKRLQATLDL